MKTRLLLLSLLLLAACTQYQYITVNSNIYADSDRKFIRENDTVSVQYVFSGPNCPLTIYVYNKLNQPLYVDWKKSAVIYGDGSRVSLWNDQSVINAGTVGAAVRVGNIVLSGSQTSGVVDRREQVSFIPPASYASLCPLAIRSSFIKPLPQELKQRVPFGNMEGSMVDSYSFTPQNTPFSFRCFITLSTTDSFSNPIYIDQPFWVSDIMQTTMSPSNVAKSDNLFYVYRTTTMGHIMGGVGTAAIIAGAVYLDAATELPPPPHRSRR